LSNLTSIFSFPPSPQIFKAQLLSLLDLSSVAGIFSIIRRAAETLETATLHSSHTVALHASLLRSLLVFSPPPSSLPPPSPAPWLGIRSIPRASPPPRDLNLSNPVFFPPPVDATGHPYGSFFQYGRPDQPQNSLTLPLPSLSTVPEDEQQDAEGEVDEEEEEEEENGFSPLEDQLQLEDVFDSASLLLDGMGGDVDGDGRGWEELFNEALLSSGFGGGDATTSMFDFLVQQ